MKLVLMRAMALPGRKLQTYTRHARVRVRVRVRGRGSTNPSQARVLTPTLTRHADGSEGRVVTRDARKWAKLKPADLGGKAGGVILHPSESPMQLAHAWCLTPAPAPAPNPTPSPDPYPNPSPDPYPKPKPKPNLNPNPNPKQVPDADPRRDLE